MIISILKNNLCPDRIFASLFVFGLVLITGCNSNSNTNSDAGKNYKAPNEVIAQGKLVPESGLISVGTAPGDQIEELKVKIGDEVAKGKDLIVLASQKLRQQELAIAKSRLNDAKSKIDLESKLAGHQVDIATASKPDDLAFQVEKKSAEQLIEVQKKQVSLAEEKLKKLEKLFTSPANEDKDLVTDDELQNAKLKVERAKAELGQAEASLNTALEKERVTGETTKANIGFATSQENVAKQSPLTSLDAAVKLAQLSLDRSTIKAPISGVVLKLFSQEGDVIGNRPILQMANLKQMTCVAEVYESQLALIPDPEKRMIKAIITSPALRNPETGAAIELNGHVVKKSGLIGQATLIDPNPLAPQDRRTAEVYIVLDGEESLKIAAQYINLQVHVRLLLDSSYEE